MSTTRRQPPGIAIGGQFAGSSHAEGDVLLEDQPLAHPMPKAYSFTMLGAFGDCPRRYFHDRILKDKGQHTPTTWRNFSELRRSAQRGSKYHAALHKDDPTAAVEQTADQEGLDPTTRGELRDLTSGYRALEPDGPPEGSSSEVYVRATLLDHRFVGRIDRIQPSGRGGVTIVDSKTGQPPDGVGPDQTPEAPVRKVLIPSDFELSGGLLQVVFYSDCMSKQGHQVDSVELHYPRLVEGRPTVFEMPATPKLLERGLAQMEGTAQRVLESHRTGRFEATVGDACATCPHTRGCPVKTRS